MLVEPVHHIPMLPQYNSPFSAAFAVEGSRLLFLSGCSCVPLYHKHPHDLEEERTWLEGDFATQTEQTFERIKEVLQSVGAGLGNIVKMVIYFVDASDQNAFNEISNRLFGPTNPPARTSVVVKELVHPGLRIEVDVIAAIPPKEKRST